MTVLLDAYEGLQKALDENPHDQTLRLILADWYEEQGRPWAAECMRWLVNRKGCPYYQGTSYKWSWTRTGNTKHPRYHSGMLPDPVHAMLSEDLGTFDKNEWCKETKEPWFWWDRCWSRRLAEEAAVWAWETYRQEHPTEPL